MVINGLINCFRLVIANNKAGDRSHYVSKFTGVGNFDFSVYKGSNWKTLGDKLYATYFS